MASPKRRWKERSVLRKVIRAPDPIRRRTEEGLGCDAQSNHQVVPKVGFSISLSGERAELRSVAARRENASPFSELDANQCVPHQVMWIIQIWESPCPPAATRRVKSRAIPLPATSAVVKTTIERGLVMRAPVTNPCIGNPLDDPTNRVSQEIALDPAAPPTQRLQGSPPQRVAPSLDPAHDGGGSPRYMPNRERDEHVVSPGAALNCTRQALHLGRNRSKLANSTLNSAQASGQMRPNALNRGRSRANFAELGPTIVEVGRACAESSQIRLDLGTIRPNLGPPPYPPQWNTTQANPKTRAAIPHCAACVLQGGEQGPNLG